MTIEKTTRLNLLFDFYGPLLTDRQRELFESYYQFDLSLAEIAINFSISRQAVFDMLRRTEIQLETYEKKLLLSEKHQSRLHLIDQLSKGISEGFSEDDLVSIVQKIKLI